MAHRRSDLPALQDHRMVDGDKAMSFKMGKEGLGTEGWSNLVTDALFMSVILRFTGYVEVLSQYNSTSVNGMHLPAMEDTESARNSDQ